MADRVVGPAVDRIAGGPPLALEAAAVDAALFDEPFEEAVFEETTAFAATTDGTTGEESEQDAAPSEAPAGTSSSSPAPAPALGTLSDLAWLTNALNGTTGSLLVPLANGTRLLRLGVNEENKPFEECSLPESAGAGAAHCRHLPHCVLPDISKDMPSYVRYFCSIGDFAGVCCPDAAFPAAPHA